MPEKKAPRASKAARPDSSRAEAPSARAPRSTAARKLQAAGHQRTRKAHQTETAEDYVEVIAGLIDSTGEARVVDVAECLGVSHVTVVRTLARLHREGLVDTRPYRAIFLTTGGRRLAAQARKRHEIVLAFLRALGVPDSVARHDAEGIEHHVSAQTLAAMDRFARDQKRT